jgi:hypothetical protein
VDGSSTPQRIRYAALCGGGSGATPPPPASYSVSASVTGLAGSGLTLTNNGGGAIAVSGNGIVTIAASVAATAAYLVVVTVQPSTPSQTCSVTNGSGTVGNSNVSNIGVTCATNNYAVGGSVSNLLGSGLAVANSGGSTLAISGPSYSYTLASGSLFNFTFVSQPSNPAQTCSFSGSASASGTVGGSDNTTVGIQCITTVATGTPISIDDTVAGGANTKLNLGTNQLYSVDGQTTPVPTAAQRLVQLAPSLVRMHIHAVGGDLPTAAQTVQLCPTPTDTSCHRVPWSFVNLDFLVADVFAAKAVPLMNVALPPPWMWTITDATTTPNATAYVTDENDPTHPFAMFAGYMRSLVEYYNLGSTTVTEADGSTHTLTNPSGTSHRIVWWELLNEPSISSPANPYQPVGPYPATPAFTQAQYMTMWNAVTVAMLAADPTIKLVGPALPYIAVNSPNGGAGDYISPLLSQARKPDAISFHGYSVVSNESTDLQEFAGTPSGGLGLAGIVGGLHHVQAQMSSLTDTSIPIWLDEFGFGGMGVTDPYLRPTHAFGSAYTAAAFALLSQEPQLTILANFSFSLQSLPDLSLLNPAANHQPVLLYWLYQAVGVNFPAGQTILPYTGYAPFSPSAPDLAIYATRAGDGSVSVLLSNVMPASPADKGGLGVARDVQLTLKSGPFAHITLTAVDATTPLDSGPVVTSLPSGNTATVHLPGYGVAIVRFAH